jgi:purine catabolism regulator
MVTVSRSAKSDVLTVADVLEVEEVQAAHPRVLAGRNRLHRAVRWVHISDVPDAAKYLRGGELLLTTGVGLPEDRNELAGYVRELAEAGVSGVGIELVRRFHEMPRELIDAADRWDVPLIALEKEVQFVAITEAVHAQILDRQLAKLRVQESVRHAFQALPPGASPREVVRKMSELARCPVIFEGLTHRPLAVDARTVSLEELLVGWETRSRRLDAGHSDWLVAAVEPGGQPCGRVVLLAERTPGVLHRAVLETGATMLAIGWLLAGTPASLERAAHRELVDDIVNARCRSMNEVYVRAHSLGVAFRSQRLAVLAVRSAPPYCHEKAVLQAIEWTRTVGLAGQLRDDFVCALVAVPSDETPAARVASISAELRHGYAGPPESLALGAAFLEDDATLDTLVRAISEADEAARSMLGSGDERVATIHDIELRGLLRLLQDDARVQRFVDQQLRPIWTHDAQHGTFLLDTLAAFLDCAGNKSAAAARAHRSRAAFYHSLDRLAAVLGRDLEVPEVRLALHVALLASQVGVRPESPPPQPSRNRRQRTN